MRLVILALTAALVLSAAPEKADAVPMRPLAANISADGKWVVVAFLGREQRARGCQVTYRVTVSTTGGQLMGARSGRTTNCDSNANGIRGSLAAVFNPTRWPRARYITCVTATQPAVRGGVSRHTRCVRRLI